MRENIINNTISALLYIAGAAISFAISMPQYYYSTLWIPVGLVAGFVYLKGYSVLPGIFFASIVSHLYLAKSTLVYSGDISFPFATIILLSATEIGVMYALYHIKITLEGKNLLNDWHFPIKYLATVSLVLSIPLSAVQAWFLNQLEIIGISAGFITMLVLSNAIVLFVFIPLIIVWFRDSSSQKFTKAEDDENYLEAEINRQVKEYKMLSDRLIEEIEKRGIAERDLTKSQRLLSEAQEAGNIYAWEYSINEKKFSWITKDPLSPNSDISEKPISLKNLASKLHPDDLKEMYKQRKSVLAKNNNFEFELRLLKDNGSYGYYLLRGKNFTQDNKVTKVLGVIMDISKRKKTELMLLEKEEKYQALFESNIDPICVIDAKSHTISDVNPSFENIYGYSRSEIIGKPYLTLSAQPEESKAAITFGQRKGYYRVNQRTHKKKNGEKFLIEANLMSHIVDGQEMLFIIIHDITRRKEAEIKLAEREQKYRTYFESDLIGMAEISIAKEWLAFNDKLTKILGYSPNELKTKTWDEITFQDDLQVENRLYKQVLTHETDGYSIEKRFISKNSELVNCKVTLKAIKNPKGTVSYLIILVDDISKQKRVEAELLESRKKLTHSQAVAKLGSIRFYPDVNLIVLSDEAYEMLGYGSQRPPITRKDFFKTILPSAKTRFEEIICDLENGQSVVGDYEQAFVTPKGEVKYTLTNFGVTFNINNQVSEVLATMADITRIKKAEMALQEANSLKDQIFSIIGHDLKSPIGSINQLVEMYADNYKQYDAETSKSILDTLKQTSSETFKLLENLLNWANSQRYDSFKPVETDLVSLTSQVTALLKGAANSKNLTIFEDFIPKAPAMVDEEMIKTVIRNLISNSIKFTPKAGTISISLKENQEKYIISISDTGVGIPNDILPKLFDNSTTVSTIGTNSEKGTGLGLKLVKKFVEKNSGHINVESIEGQGSTFSFSIPKYIEHDN